MDIDYSPTGREFVTGSYDRTVSFPTISCILSLPFSILMRIINVYWISFLQIRIFQYNGGRSREIYHTKRMQRFCLFYHFSSISIISSLIERLVFQIIMINFIEKILFFVWASHLKQLGGSMPDFVPFKIDSEYGFNKFVLFNLLIFFFFLYI